MAAASATEVVERYELQDGASGEWKHTPGAYLVALGPSVFSPYLGAFRDLSSSPSLGTVELADPACGGRTICDVSASVVGREVVSVPAGKFDAIKVRVLHNWRGWRGATTAAGDGPGRRELTVWYAPEVKRAVKFSSRPGQSAARVPSHMDFDLELVSYKLDGG